MRYKKIRLATQLSDLYEKDYKKHIEEGREYWWHWPHNSEVFEYTKKAWNKIRITYMRSGACFYVLSEFPHFPEHYFHIDSFMASSLEFAQIEPMKDVDWNTHYADGSKEYFEKRFCFNDDRTEVLNWDNSRESDIDESELELYETILSNENK